jgi:hypothetical protein
MFTWQMWLVTIAALYAIFLIFWALQWWLGRHMQGLGLLILGKPGAAARLYFWLLAPGVILHEMSHWLMAKLLFVPTGKMVLFRTHDKRPPRQQRYRRTPPPRPVDPNPDKVVLGYVEVAKTDPVRQSLIGLAPLITGLLVLVVLAALLNIRGVVLDINNMGQALLSLPEQLFSSFSHPVNFLWLYLVFSVSNGMLPSAADRKPWLIGFFLPGAVILGLSLAGYLRLPDDWISGIFNFMGVLAWIFAFAAMINLLLVGVVLILEYIISRLRRRRVVYRR